MIKKWNLFNESLSETKHESVSIINNILDDIGIKQSDIDFLLHDSGTRRDQLIAIINKIGK